jgi:broad specificity phosphatase PhoE
MRLTLICHGETAATRTAAFPADEPLALRAADRAARLAPGLRRADRALTSPALRARETAAALGLGATSHPALAECDYGRWSGRTLAGIEADEPEALARWLADPSCAPHGGEALEALFRRVAGFMEAQRGERGHTIAVTHASIIRAAVLHVLGAPIPAFWRIDVPPLSVADIRSDGARWTLRALGAGIAGTAGSGAAD